MKEIITLHSSSNVVLQLTTADIKGGRGSERRDLEMERSRRAHTTISETNAVMNPNRATPNNKRKQPHNKERRRVALMYSSEGGSLVGTTALTVEPTSILTKQKNSMNVRRNTQSKRSDMSLSGGTQNAVHHHREETAVQAIDWRQIGKHSVSHTLQGEIKKGT